MTDPAAIALWSGLLAAVTPAVSGSLAPLFGRLADRFGRKMMLIRSLRATCCTGARDARAARAA